MDRSFRFLLLAMVTISMGVWLSITLGEATWARSYTHFPRASACLLATLSSATSPVASMSKPLILLALVPITISPVASVLKPFSLPAGTARTLTQLIINPTCLTRPARTTTTVLARLAFQCIQSQSFEVLYDTNGFANEWYGNFRPSVLSNGDSTSHGFHGDFVNGWDVNVLQKAVNNCLPTVAKSAIVTRSPCYCL